MRSAFVVFHRWAGLFTALFLFVSGLTGAVISWDHEIDEWLNPEMFDARSGDIGTPLAPLELANRLEAADGRLRVSYLPLSIKPEHTLLMVVGERLNPATGRAFDLPFNQVALDPVTGEVQGQRRWGAISLSRENLLPFLYKLHYSLHLPRLWDIETGIVFMGLVAIVWTLDCLVALWISFPSFQSWRKSFAFRWRAGSYKLTFDLHRSGGVWLWGLLLILAMTSVSLNLNETVMRPVVSLFSTLTPGIYESRTPVPSDQPIEPALTREQILVLARAEAQRRGWTVPAGGMFYAARYGLYGISFFEHGQDHADQGLGNPQLYFNAQTGAFAGEQQPGKGSFGDIFLQAQFPLHSGRILGLPGRILVSTLGLVVALLSATGILIWARKRRARQIAVRAIMPKQVAFR